MKSERLTDSDVRIRGWEALVDRLGPAGALRYALQTERGYGDYAEIRHRMLGRLSVNDLLKRMPTSEPRRRRHGERTRR
jgi:hypothetical protein